MRMISRNSNRLKRREIKKSRKICRRCGKNNAKYIRVFQRKKKGISRLGRRSRVKADRYHDLCPRCNRSQWESIRAKQLISSDISDVA